MSNHICKKCNNIIPESIIINGKTFDLSNRNYCPACFKFTERKCNGDDSLKATKQTERFCPECKNIKSIENFLYLKNAKRYLWYCKTCKSKIQRNKILKFKQECVNYKGGECIRCGYNKSLSALDFHHKDPKQKDFNIGSMWRKGFKSVKNELDKCDLLCSNCHRELHETINKLKLC